MARSRDQEAGEAKYEEFHRYPPKKIGEFGKGFELPKEMRLGGKALSVAYESKKVDPATLVRPRKPVSYLHEHDTAGVTTYLAAGSKIVVGTARKVVRVPDEFRKVETLVKLGEFLFLTFENDDGDEVELQGTHTPSLPELYAIPSGKCLYVIDGKRKVIAATWGGGLTVRAAGIDG